MLQLVLFGCECVGWGLGVRLALFYDFLIFGIWTKNLVCLEKAIYPCILFIVSTLGIYLRGVRQLYSTQWASHYAVTPRAVY